MSEPQWVYKRGELSQGPWESVVNSQLEGWQHTGIRVCELSGNDSIELAAEAVERLIIPLAGSASVEHAGGRSELAGRKSVFHGPTDVLYLGAQTAATLSGVGRIAVAEAPATQTMPTAYIAREDVPVELRGAGRSSRQVHNFGTPQALAAQKFIVCEVITPAENWSSYPPHKHDEHNPGVETRLEEIYYFETAVSRGLDAQDAAKPFGMFATYSSSAGEIDIAQLVHTGDIALVPYGYHGPAAAAPGYDLYYLNVMAGPDEERAWNITDDPSHGWVRAAWDGQEFDSRLPYTAEEA